MERKLTAREILGIVLVTALAVLLAWRLKHLEGFPGGRNPAALQGKQAPEFSLPSLEGRQVSRSDYQGKKLVIAYWASWCGPCRMEMPSLVGFYRAFHKPDSEFELLAISIDEDRSRAESYARAERLPFPVLLDPDSRAADAYSVGAIPALFVVEQDGRVSYAETGTGEMLATRLAARLGLALERPAPPGSGEPGHTGD